MLGYLMDTVALAFVALGVITAITWLRRRDRSMGFLALAIILLAVVVGEGRLQTYLPFAVPLLGATSLVGFMGCAYALLRYRDAIIPLPRRWHAAALIALVAASVSIFAVEGLTKSTIVRFAIAIGLIAVWIACVGEPIVRFWLVARTLPAVQAWRLRSLSLGFGGLVVVLLVAISVGLLVKQMAIQVAIEL